MAHIRGNKHCPDCCCGTSKCNQGDCDGIAHMSVVDEVQYSDDEWEWVHDFKCDKCGFYTSYGDSEDMFVFAELNKETP